MHNAYIFIPICSVVYHLIFLNRIVIYKVALFGKANKLAYSL